MHMANAKRRWTIDELHGLPEDGNKYELIKGQLFVTPAPSRNHQRAVRELTLVIEPYVRAERIGEVIFAPADIVVFDDNTVSDQSTFARPHAFSTGFSLVIVNGAITLENGKHTGARNGTILKGPGSQLPY